MGLLEQKLLGWIATKSVKNSAGSLKILRVQNVMSWRSAGSWTRCTRSNAFPEVGIPFLNSSMKKKIDWFLTKKNEFENQNCALFDLRNQKESKAYNFVTTPYSSLNSAQLSWKSEVTLTYIVLQTFSFFSCFMEQGWMVAFFLPTFKVSIGIRYLEFNYIYQNEKLVSKFST